MTTLRARGSCVLLCFTALCFAAGCVAPGTGWRSEPALCRVVGMVGGGVIGATTNSSSNDDNGDTLAGTLVGAGVGFLLGHFLCMPPAEALSLRVTATPYGGVVPLTTELRARAEGATSFAWDLGDGTRASGSRVTHTYSEPGRYDVRVTARDASGQSATKRMPLEVTAPATRRIVLRGANFAHDSARLTPEGRAVLDLVAENLATQPEARISVVGHADATGSNAFNMALSESRANAVRDYLIERGIPRRQLSAEGRGETEPVASNHTPAGRAQNRRVELLVQ